MNEPQIYHQARAWLRANRPALPTLPALSGLVEPSASRPLCALDNPQPAGLAPRNAWLAAFALAVGHVWFTPKPWKPYGLAASGTAVLGICQGSEFVTETALGVSAAILVRYGLGAKKKR